MTLFHLLALVGLAFGVMTGWGFGHRFGIGGNLVGAVLGGYLGYWIGQIPWFFAIWYFTR